MKLNSNFALDRYGLQVRFVNEDDAEYIVKLRSDPRLGRYLNVTEDDVEKQKQWIRNYKGREESGQEYYFMYLQNGNRIGVNRIYNIKGTSATCGSWVCSPGLPFELPVLTVVLIREIFFEILQLEVDYMDTRKDNKKVIRMHHMLGAHKTGENDIDVFHYLTRDDFKKNKQKFLNYVYINSENQ